MNGQSAPRGRMITISHYNGHGAVIWHEIRNNKFEHVITTLIRHAERDQKLPRKPGLSSLWCHQTFCYWMCGRSSSITLQVKLCLKPWDKRLLFSTITTIHRKKSSFNLGSHNQWPKAYKFRQRCMYEANNYFIVLDRQKNSKLLDFCVPLGRFPLSSCPGNSNRI